MALNLNKRRKNRVIVFIPCYTNNITYSRIETLPQIKQQPAS